MKVLWSWFWHIAATLLVLMICYQAWIAAQIAWWISHNPSTSAFMDDRLVIMQSKDPKAKLQHKWVDYKYISNHLKRALIASEDAKFVDHEGFDWEGIQKAYEKNMARGKIVAGGSTISQQLAKNLFLSTKRTPWRKGEETLITLMLEAMMKKERIFEIYMNTIEWGVGIFGVEAAANHYYQISAAQLSAEQAARLAAMVPNPRYYDSHQEAKGLLRKTEIILNNMDYSDIP